MGFFDKLFGKQNRETKQDQGSKKIPDLNEFPQLNAKERMGLIMALGDSGNPNFFQYLKYAIEQDDDLNVKFAALKRIHLFKDLPETTIMLTQLKNNGGGEKMEPYFSMALSRLGIITVKEFEDKMNKSQ